LGEVFKFREGYLGRKVFEKFPYWRGLGKRPLFWKAWLVRRVWEIWTKGGRSGFGKRLGHSKLEEPQNWGLFRLKQGVYQGKGQVWAKRGGQFCG